MEDFPKSLVPPTLYDRAVKDGLIDPKDARYIRHEMARFEIPKPATQPQGWYQKFNQGVKA